MMLGCTRDPLKLSDGPVVGNYGPPPGFQWEWGTPEGNAEPFKDDPNLEEYNVDSRIEEFVAACLQLSNVTVGNDIMLTMGTDFTYSNAFVWCAL